ncbi:phage tail sheath family protein [Xanthomarina sp. F2636L]|uniref:phage tail sheath family protein n=1 Tax=Xanthomarina sp. F2636L TaxID=2996018 RepID=UPI00225E0030|nr:phage tail sheath C-terminal domain-containing protein [Xanthomarina sp. F2636L]MCX7549640.1 phage tail sheath subtilisin-like domain-containing protein [Xanthomarina sp. F2636L]
MNKRFTIGFALVFIFVAPIFSQEKAKRLKKNDKKENTINKDKLEKEKWSANAIDSSKQSGNNLNNQTPGLYIEEVSVFPPSVTQVETTIPAFIGYTEKGPNNPTPIQSMLDYINIFGGPFHSDIGVFEVDINEKITNPNLLSTPKYKMYYMLKMFFANGGTDCFIVSVGNYDEEDSSVKNNEMLVGLELLNQEDLPTLILFPDATSSKNSQQPAELYDAALLQAAIRKDRFLICDVEVVENDIVKSAEFFRNSIGTSNLAYGAAYFPSLETTLNYVFTEDKIPVILEGNNNILVLKHTERSISENPRKIEESLFHAKNGKYKNVYAQIHKTLQNQKLTLPPSAAVAGVYAQVDANRGVWKAPANVSLNNVQAPKIEINNSDQGILNIDSSGKSINAIRKFTNKGTMVWGARTLAGNDNEWRYISVRRLVNVVEESTRKATEQFVFEPNDANTWVRSRAMIENYLTTLWREGALSGAKPEEAFYVRVGLGQTMTAQDLLYGNMNVEIGMAVSKPAEFIVIRFTQKMTSH